MEYLLDNSRQRNKVAESQKTKSDARESKYTTFGVPQGKGVGYTTSNTLTPEQAAQYEDMLSYADNVQQSLAIQNQLTALKNTPSKSGQFNTAFDELQALVRYTGLSKGTTQIGSGIWSPEDTKGFMKVLQSAYESGITYEAVLEQLAGQGPATKTPKTTFSKSISQALTLMDEGDAKAALSSLMYKEYGFFPSSKQVADFSKKWNAEAKRQASTSTTSTTTTRSGTGQTISKGSTLNVGKGFTEAEQSQFLAQYLKDQFNVKKELGGRAKELYDSVTNTYKNNLLPIPSFDQVTKQVVKLIGAGEMGEQMLTELQTKVRRQAKALFPGWADYLDQGDDLVEYANNYAKFASQKLGRDVKSDDEVVKKLMSFSDVKGPRPPSNQEAINFIESTSEWKSSTEGKTYYIGLADRLTRGM